MNIRSKFQGDTCEFSHFKEIPSCPKTVMSSYFVMTLDNSAIVPNNEVR
jgi:hypothetical protein